MALPLLLTAFARLLACGFAFLLAGYSGMRYFYNSPDDGKPSAEKLSHLDFAILTLCSFLTGAGGNGGLTAAVNASAKSFPDEMVRLGPCIRTVLLISSAFREHLPLDSSSPGLDSQRSSFPLWQESCIRTTLRHSFSS